MGQVILARHSSIQHLFETRIKCCLVSFIVLFLINLFVLFLTGITYLIDAGDAGLVLFIYFFSCEYAMLHIYHIKAIPLDFVQLSLTPLFPWLCLLWKHVSPPAEMSPISFLFPLFPWPTCHF